MVTISPDKWIRKYIKSATNGRLISMRTSRLLTLVLVPIWLLGLVMCIMLCYDGTKAIFNLKKLKSEANSDIGEYIERGLEDQEIMLRKMHGNPYLKLKYIPPNYEHEIKVAQRDILQLFALPMYVIVFFIVPWIVLRLIFWVVDADKTNQVD